MSELFPADDEPCDVDTWLDALLDAFLNRDPHPLLPASAERVSLESDWMGRLTDLVGERGRWVRRVLDPGNPSPGNPERVLRHALELTNATDCARAYCRACHPLQCPRCEKQGTERGPAVGERQLELL